MSRLGEGWECWAVLEGTAITETYTDPGRYLLDGDELVWDRAFGRPRNSVVMPAGWTVVERDVQYGPRTGGKSKVSGSLSGSVHAGLDFWRAIS